MSLDTRHTTSSIIQVTLDANHEDNKLLLSLNKKIKDYEARVWSNGLQDIVEKDPNRGMIGSLRDSASLMTYVLAGRVMTTFQDKDGNTLTTLAGEGEKPSRMGLHGIDGSIQHALDLLDLACDVWEKKELVMGVDNEVTLDVLANVGTVPAI